MGCLKGGVVANRVVPTPKYVRFAMHYRFRPDFCEAADPESKGVVEALVGYAKSDLVVPAGGWTGPTEANADARSWCAEVNAHVHSETAAVPTKRLATERALLRPLPSLRPPLREGVLRKVDRLATVRFGLARYSAPKELVGQRVAVAQVELRGTPDGIARKHGARIGVFIERCTRCGKVSPWAERHECSRHRQTLLAHGEQERERQTSSSRVSSNDQL